MLRIGIDLGGTKIAAAVLDSEGATIFETRTPTPKADYWGTINEITNLVDELETKIGQKAPVGIGIPGSLCHQTGLVQNANSTWLNGKPLAQDLPKALNRPVKISNDANCFAISEATDGAGRNMKTVFGVILGTGCGAGIIHQGRIISGPLGIGGEWGHTPLPWPEDDEYPGPKCWCGRRSCLEAWISGPGLAADHKRTSGETLTPEEIVTRSAAGETAAKKTLQRHADRVARGLSVVVNILDPDIIVLGGGLSKLQHLYEVLPTQMKKHIFSDAPEIKIVPPVHGDAGGVRGAAWLWRIDEIQPDQTGL